MTLHEDDLHAMPNKLVTDIIGMRHPERLLRAVDALFCIHISAGSYNGLVLLLSNGK